MDIVQFKYGFGNQMFQCDFVEVLCERCVLMHSKEN